MDASNRIQLFCTGVENYKFRESNYVHCNNSESKADKQN